MVLHGDHGSAWRRRQRRLRSWWRHEQQSVAMALYAAAHHSFDKVAAGEMYDGLRAQKTDRAWEAANKALRRQRSKAAGDAVFFELSDEDTSGVRPGVLASAAGTGPAARRGAHHRPRLMFAHGADTRCICAADGGQCDGYLPMLGEVDCRAGYRSAQDLWFVVSFPRVSP